MAITIAETADVDATASIGEGSKIWHLAQIRDGVVIGENCIVSRGAYIGSGVKIGNNCKIQNFALVYEPARLGNGVFIGPAVVLTNDQYPRAVNPDLTLKDGSDWDAVGVTIGDGASIGAQSVCIAPVKIGAWALVAAGSVVTKDVPEFALVAGNPAKRIRWVGRAGVPLIDLGENNFKCPITGDEFEEINSHHLLDKEKG